jgi:catechol 2,3-dioxygenase
MSMGAAGDTADFVTPTLHHLALKTRRAPEMVKWYGAVLGLKLVVDLGFATFLSNDAANHRLVLFSSDRFVGEAEEARVGLHHWSFQFDEPAGLAASYRRLAAEGIRPNWVVNHGPTTSFYYADPDGNQVEMQLDNFGNDAASTAFMQGPGFSGNPMGADIDPDQFVAAVDEGATREQLHERSYAGEFLPADKVAGLGPGLSSVEAP